MDEKFNKYVSLFIQYLQKEGFDFFRNEIKGKKIQQEYFRMVIYLILHPFADYEDLDHIFDSKNRKRKSGDRGRKTKEDNVAVKIHYINKFFKQHQMEWKIKRKRKKGYYVSCSQQI